MSKKTEIKLEIKLEIKARNQGFESSGNSLENRSQRNNIAILVAEAVYTQTRTANRCFIHKRYSHTYRIDITLSLGRQTVRRIIVLK